MYSSVARSLVKLGCATAVVALAACAPLPAQVGSVGRTTVGVDSSTDLQWKYWGTDAEILDVLPKDLAKDKPLTAKLWQMRTSLGELVGVMSVRSNTDDLNNRNTVWTEDCPKQKGVLVERTQGLNIGRVDCLRIKRTANSTDWLAENDPSMAARLEAAGVYFARPVSYVSYQFTTSNGGYVEVQVLADHRLVATRQAEGIFHIRTDAQHRRYVVEARRQRQRVRHIAAGTAQHFAIRPHHRVIHPLHNIAVMQ